MATMRGDAQGLEKRNSGPVQAPVRSAAMMIRLPRSCTNRLLIGKIKALELDWNGNACAIQRLKRNF